MSSIRRSNSKLQEEILSNKSQAIEKSVEIIKNDEYGIGRTEACCCQTTPERPESIRSSPLSQKPEIE
jgi:hypothetical protein